MNGFLSSHFADAATAYPDARYVIFGIPFDHTTSFRAGTRAGPRVIRELSYNFESWMPGYGLDLADVPVADMGDLDINVLPDDMVLEVHAAVQRIVSDGKIPVMLGGEHSITPGAVHAVKPDCYVVCDAHLDLREEYRGTVHNHACTTRRVYNDGVTDIIIIGARSGTKDQFEFARDHLSMYSSDDVREEGLETVIREVRKKVAGKRVYLSVDADVIDCCLTPGLGTPEPFGLAPQDIRDLLRAIAPYTVAFDYVEVCPAFDHGQAATVAALLVREFIAAHWTAGRK